MQSAPLSPLPQPSRRIDAHQHFWRYSTSEYAWIDARMDILARDHLPADLLPELTANGIDASIAVQARQSLDETRWLLDLATRHPTIIGVVGWVPLADPQIATILASLAHPRFVGVRHVVQGETDPRFLLQPAIERGLRAVTAANLAYDLLILDHQLEQAIACVDRHPQQRFILDHVAKPRIAAQLREPWAQHLRELAARPHVAAKISGLVSEADWATWTAADLLPYLDIALEAFGPQRLLFGSDWPVCRVASDYGRWYTVVSHWLRCLTTSEQAAILGGNATRFYRLESP